MKAADYRGLTIGEHALQVGVIHHLRMCATADTYWFAIPNAGKRSVVVAARMTAEGLSAGVADLCIMRSGGWVGWLELKTGKGRQSPRQREFEQICRVLCHPYAVARSHDGAIAVLKSWGALK